MSAKNLKGKNSATPAVPVSISTAAETSAPISEPTPTAEPISTEAPSLENRDSLRRHFRHLLTLSDEGKQYINTVISQLKEPNADGEKRMIEVKTLTDPMAGEAVVVVDATTKASVLLLFTESYTTSAVPITDRAPSIKQSLVRGCQGHGEEAPKIVQMIVVDKAAGDYARADRMATHIYNIFSALDHRNDFNADIYKSLKFIPNTNVKAVRDFIDRRSPHAVQDRIDWGVLLEIESHSEATTGYLITAEPLHEAVMAVGGYTKFTIKQEPSGIKIQPICVISSIVSDIPVSGILNMAIPVAAGTAIMGNKWQLPYCTFGKDQPNLGYFFTEPDNKSLKFFTSMDELNGALMASFAPAIIAIDVPEGRAHLPELENLYQTSKSAQEPLVVGFPAVDETGKEKIEYRSFPVSVSSKFLLESAMRFFNTPGMKKDKKPSFNPIGANGAPMDPTPFAPFINYEGTVLLNGKLVDTRTCDYINLITLTKTTSLTTNTFLAQTTDPSYRAKNIQQLIGEDAVNLTYRGITVIIHPDFANALAELMSQAVRYYNQTSSQNNLPLYNLINGLGTQIGGNNTVYGGFNNTNNISNIYC